MRKLISLLEGEKKTIIEVLISNTKPLLDRILITFPQYTDHGHKHSERIIAILERVILDGENFLFLENNQWTLFFLIASAYLHDIGMVDFPDLLPENQNSISQDYIRQNHNNRSAEIINLKWKEFGLIDIFQARIIGDICKKHRGDIDDADFISIKAYSTEAVNIGFCVACIRLADELDLPKERVDRRLAEFITDPISQLEWKTHYSISGVIPHPNLKQVILIECYCTNKEAHRKLKSLETKINKLLSSISLHVEPRISYTKCIFQIEASGYIDKDLKFTIDENSLWPMIIGDILYKDSRIFIRELIQNAIDACMMQKYRMTDYVPQINLFYSFKEVKIVDNGTGMDLNLIEKYLIRICLSYYSSDAFSSDSKIGYYPISKFGIGIFSCFMVSNMVQIKTSTGNGKVYHLKIHDVRDYIQLEETEENFKGTEVKVMLKVGLQNVIKFLRENFQHTDVLINYYYPDGHRESIGKRPFSKTDFLKFGKGEYKYANEYPIHFERSIGYVWYFPISTSSTKTKIETEEQSNFLIIMNGIKIGFFSLLPRWVKLKKLSGILNLLENERIDITASRNEIIYNEKYKNLIKKIEKTIIKIIRDLLYEIPDDPIKIREFFKLNIEPVKEANILVELIKSFYYFEFSINKKRSMLRFNELSQKVLKIDERRLNKHLSYYDLRLYQLSKETI